MAALDYFAFFGLGRRLSLDPADLEDRFHRLSRQLHPDRYAQATPAERQRALEASAVLNDGYRVLRDPVARAGHLLGLLGLPAAEQPAPELLDEMFELNLEREQVRSAGAAEALECKLAELRRRAATDLERLFRAYDEAPGQDTLAAVRRSVSRLKYLIRLSSQAVPE